VLGLCAAALAASPAAGARTVSLPWPPQVLPPTPPLAPKVAGPLPISPRFFRRVSNREHVLVGMDVDGTPNSVTVIQTMLLNRLGDYVFAIAAPVVSVLPGPRTQSPPGQRTNQILWQGFSPGQRLLSSRSELRLEESAPFLPVKTRVESRQGRTTVVIENITGVTAASYSGDVEPTSLAQVLGRIRSATKRNHSAEGLNVELRGRKTPLNVMVAAPLRVTGVIDAGPGPRRFSGLLDGIRRRSLRVTVPGADRPAVTFTVRTAAVSDKVNASQTSRTRLAGTIAFELTYARKRQYDQFVASPDTTGHSSTTYVYATTPRRTAAAPVERSGSSDNTMGWIALAVLLAAALPVAAVFWARS
jgi:hypothetical protein